MHSAEASDLITGTCGRIRPPRRLTASITSGHAVTACFGGEPGDQRA